MHLFDRDSNLEWQRHTVEAQHVASWRRVEGILDFGHRCNSDAVGIVASEHEDCYLSSWSTLTLQHVQYSVPIISIVALALVAETDLLTQEVVAMARSAVNQPAVGLSHHECIESHRSKSLQKSGHAHRFVDAAADEFMVQYFLTDMVQ